MKYIKKTSASYQGDTPIATSITSSSTNDEVAGAKAVLDFNSYSTTEHVVGTWIDGKPVYEKIYENNSLTLNNNSGTLADTRSLNIETSISCIVMVGTPTANAGAWRGGYLNANYYSGYQINSEALTIFAKDADTNPIKVRAIIRYTKTTDSAS